MGEGKWGGRGGNGGGEGEGKWGEGRGRGTGVGRGTEEAGVVRENRAGVRKAEGYRRWRGVREAEVGRRAGLLPLQAAVDSLRPVVLCPVEGC